METGSYRFRLGNFECMALLDGSMDYEPRQFFANADEAQVVQVLREHGMPTDQIITPYTYLFVSTSDHRVLVDMGAGDLGDDTGKLVHNMRAAGIDPAEIDTVVITHAHGDHVGRSIDDQERLVYPNARYYIWKGEWDFWFSDFDILPEQAAASKRRVFDDAASRQVWVMGQHFPPFPSPGHIVKQGDGWKWQPIEVED
jgi:glyoxylase-like metal-dependent hydrolase (beta-lactamase superfamily II)